MQTTNHTPILVVIPYCSEGAQGHELELAVAGWRRHFKENFLIVLAGEDHPVTRTGYDICCVSSRRVTALDDEYRSHLDYVSCLKKVRAAFPKSEGFIMVADDCYAVGDFDFGDVASLKAYPGEILKVANPFNRWQVDAVNTRSLLERDGYPVRNFTTHLPQWYEWDKLDALWEKYDMAHHSRVMEDLYYNIYYGNCEPIILAEDDDLQCGVFEPGTDLSRVERAIGRKKWVMNSAEAWTPQFEQLLKNYYGI